MNIYPEELKQFCSTVSPIKLSVTKNSDEILVKSKLETSTSFLDIYDKVPLVLRYYCVIEDISEIPKCCCGNPVTFNKAYPNKGFGKFCSPSCSRSNKTVNKEILDLLKDRDWLYNERITLKKSKELIASELGCSTVPVNKWLKIHKIPAVKYNESNSESLLYLRDYSWMYDQYVVNRKPLEEIAKILGVAKSTVGLYMNKLNIAPNDPNSYDRKIQKVTKPVLEIKDFIRSFYSGEIRLNVRNIIGSLELDLYLPEYNFAIKFNGVYSHLYRPEETNFSARKDHTYHLTKTKLCEEKGIQLVHIFSSSWNIKKEIWKSFIKNKLGYTEYRLYARSCNIREVSVHEKTSFLEENHLQGKDKSKIKLGLYHKEELVCLMTFGKSRYNKNFDWELIRFCNKKNYNIVGGFSKLLTHFTKNYSGSIISYADRSYSNGDLYQKNGFTLHKVNKPNYYYVKKNSEIMIHRSNFTKSKILKILNKPEWTEEQLMFELDYSKIFDCGTKTYIIK